MYQKKFGSITKQKNPQHSYYLKAASWRTTIELGAATKKNARRSFLLSIANDQLPDATQGWPTASDCCNTLKDMRIRVKH